MNRIFTILWIAAVQFALFAGQLHAVEQTIHFNGVFTTVFNPEGPFQVGKPYEVTVRYDTEFTTDSDPRATVGLYDAIVSVSIDYDNGTYVGSANHGSMAIFDFVDQDMFSANADTTGPGADFPSVNGQAIQVARIDLADSPAGVFADDSLPFSIDPSDFDSGQLVFDFGFHQEGGIGNIEAVPEPSTLPMILVGALLIVSSAARICPR